MTQPELPRPDQDQPPAEPRERTAWQRAVDHAGPITAPAIHPSARTPLASRAQARLGRGARRIWARGSAFVRGEDLQFGARLSRWAVMGTVSFIVEQSAAAKLETAGVS
ncbi:MAG TPA: hypothetical protein VHF26_23735, partial [Trebonia sp.]|nr:hypothetical protein [Trebonia sp.]